jgi:hypothetical protein
MSEVIEKVDGRTKKAEKPALRKWRITFHGEGGDVEIGHNFKLNLYKRNVETVIDQNYLAVLRNAVVETEVQDDQNNRKKVKIPQFSYTLGEEV